MTARPPSLSGQRVRLALTNRYGVISGPPFPAGYHGWLHPIELDGGTITSAPLADLRMSDAPLPTLVLIQGGIV